MYVSEERQLQRRIYLFVCLFICFCGVRLQIDFLCWKIGICDEASLLETIGSARE